MRSVTFNSLWLHGLQPRGSSIHGISQARILEQGCHFLLQRMFLTQGSNQVSWTSRQILYHWATKEAHTIHTGEKKKKHLSLMSGNTWQTWLYFYNRCIYSMVILWLMDLLCASCALVLFYATNIVTSHWFLINF